MNKTTGLLVALLLLGTTTARGHDGKTPFSVLKGMKQQKTGPYASPMMMRNKTLVADWLKIRTIDSGDGARSGVLIVEITEDGLADMEGLDKGDLIIAINDTPIKTLADLEGFLEGIEHPEVYTFRLIRDDDEEDEEVYLDNNLFEMDDEMADLIMSKRKNGEFKQGMLREDFMARSPLGSMDKGGGPGGAGGMISPQAIMKQMMAKTPMGQRGVYPDNMKNADLPGQYPVSSPSKDSKKSFRVASRDTRKSDPLFTKADYQVAIDRKISVMEHPKSLKALTLSPDQKGKVVKLNREVKKYLVKQDALLALFRLDVEGALEDNSPDEATGATEEYHKLQQEKYIRLVRFVVEFEKNIDKNQKEIFRSLAK